MSDRGRFEHASRVMHHGRKCARCTQFYTDAEGEVHPIRGSPGYDPSIEAHGRAERERRRQTAMYGHERQERRSSVVERPPWAAGLTDRHLLTIAKAHGVSAGAPLWWERANLVGNTEQIVGGRRFKAKASGELHYALEGRSSFDRRRSAGVDTVERELAEMSPRERRAALARDRARQRKTAEDLPF